MVTKCLITITGKSTQTLFLITIGEVSLDTMLPKRSHQGCGYKAKLQVSTDNGSPNISAKLSTECLESQKWQIVKLMDVCNIFSMNKKGYMG